MLTYTKSIYIQKFIILGKQNNLVKLTEHWERIIFEWVEQIEKEFISRQ